MRFLELELENINSLKGKWKIDFTHPDYKKNNDIFVICGPTGSGKTSILDAITLALYGKTPRQKTITGGKNINELMTQKTATCYAKVKFLCKKGTFYSEFFQKRARNNPEGNLQDPECRITDEEGNIISINKPSQQEAFIQKIIGLDYSQFCRSIMLAQGNFNAFLDSNNDERALILERLTGTEKYRKIAQRICEKAKEVKSEYDFILHEKEMLSGKILSEEELSENKSLLEKYELNLKEKKQERELYTELIAWRESLESQKEKLDKLNFQKEEIEQRIKDFETDSVRLSRGKDANECREKYSLLQNSRKDQEKDTLEFETKKSKSEDIKKNLELAEEKFNEKDKELKTQKEEFEIKKRIFDEVREKDNQIKNLFELKQELENSLEEKKTLLEESKDKLEVLEKSLSDIHLEFEKQSKYLEENSNDEKIELKLDLLKEKYNNFLSNGKSIIEKNENCKNLEEEFRFENEKLVKLKVELEELNCEKNKILLDNFSIISRELQKTLKEGIPCPVCGSLNHSNISEIHKEESKDREKVQNVATSLNDFEKRFSKCKDEYQTCEIKTEKISLALESNQKEIDSLNKMNSRLENEMNEILADWNFMFTELEMDSIISSLVLKVNSYKQYKKDFDKNKNVLLSEKAELNSLKELIEIYEKDKLKLESQFELKKSEYEEKLFDRKKLFGEKKVEEEEEKISSLIRSLEGELNLLRAQKEDNKNEEVKISATLKQLEKNIASRNEIINKQEDEFLQIISKKNFFCEEEFLKYLLDEKEFENLSLMQENLEKESIEIFTSEKNAREEYESTLSLNKTEDSKEDLISKREECIQTEDSIQKEMTEISFVLKQNSEVKKEILEVEKRYEKISQIHQKWETIKKWIGKVDGSTLSTYVQSMVFKNLINYANVYLYDITNKYTLEQKGENSLEFIIRDNNFKDTRAISNISGGEKFIVSLSLALGISKFASHNIKIDSLFLDEGFGTLSGDYLTEAINALKKLQQDGKVLGIITHVQEVINEISQKIEVSPSGGGFSKIKGSGVYRL